VLLNLSCALEVHFSTSALSLALTSETEIREVCRLKKEKTRFDVERKW
jgi:hypothetical protein